MKFTDLFIRRPILAVVVNLVILVAGLAAAFTLTVRQYPKLESASVVVRTFYFGADADLVRGFITTPLERAIASVDGIDYLDSSSSQGVSEIRARLRLNHDVNAALAEISSKIDQVRGELPPEAEDPSVEVQRTDSQIASMYLSFSSESLEGNQITDYLVRVVQPQLTAVPGVQRAEILGARTFAMRVWLKPDRLAAVNLSPTDVRQALAANNYIAAIGSTKGSMVTVNLTANTDLRTREEFEELVVGGAGDAVVRLRDVADVVLGAESYDEDVRFDGLDAVFIGVYVLPNANTIDVIRAVRAELPAIEARMPTAMKLAVPYDATEYIEDAISEIVKTLLETLLIVAVVIFLFLGSLRSVLVPLVAMPLSLIGGVFLMMVFGFTINLLTLLAIVLAVGIVVDDAIVVVENIERHIREGRTPFSAAILGARELVGPVVAMTVTLAAVYAPIGFQGGLTGALFREFAFTLAGAVTISGIVALTLSPVMASRMLRAHHDGSGLAGRIDRGFDRLRRLYARVVDFSLVHRGAVYILFGTVVFLAVPFWMTSMKELAPVEDTGFLFGIVQNAPNATIEQKRIYDEQVHGIVSSFPETANVFQVTLGNIGFFGFVTTPWGQRDRTTIEIQPEVQQQLNNVAGAEVFTVTPAALPGGSDFAVDFVIQSTDDLGTMLPYIEQLVAEANASGQFMFVTTDLKVDRPQVEIILDRDKIASMGLSLQQIGADLGTLLGGGYVNRFSIDGRSYRVIPQTLRESRLTPDQILDLQVRGPGGQLVPLRTFATLETSTEPRSLSRFQQLNSARLQGQPAFGSSLDAALQWLERRSEEVLPAGYKFDYAGESRQLRREGNALLPALGLALVLIFLVLAAQFESFRDPFVILLGSVPLALSGALLFPFLGVTSINIYSQVGLITLVGLVSKNGILIVEFANELQRRGLPKRQAIIDAAGVRLRPVLMTSAATFFGHLPLVFVTGAGAASRNSIGITLVGGIAIGTLFTLLVIPALYMLIARNQAAALEREKAQDKEVSDLDAEPASHGA